MIIPSKFSKRSTILIGIVHVYMTFNNTLITISNIKGKVLFFASAGFLGLKGARRSTSYAGQSIASILGKKMYLQGFRYIFVQLKGFGSARKTVLKGFVSSNLKILAIKNNTPISHNGCKTKKKRRV